MLMQLRSSLVLLSGSAALAGCASVAVSNDAIETNTAQALGLQKGAFVISDRVDDGVKSSYNVKTGKGKSYSCYVTGGVSVVGRVVSDAICTETNSKGTKTAATPAAPQTQPVQKDCNALLKAAGKCS
jgi:hypothetical protein